MATQLNSLEAWNASIIPGPVTIVPDPIPVPPTEEEVARQTFGQKAHLLKMLKTNGILLGLLDATSPVIVTRETELKSLWLNSYVDMLEG
jgi:hypothetical protein